MESRGVTGSVIDSERFAVERLFATAGDFMDSGDVPADRGLLGRQRSDGSVSWGDHRFNGVEETARLLLALKAIGRPRDCFIELALQFLSKQIRRDDGSVRSSSDAIDQGWPEGPILDRAANPHFLEGVGIRRTYPAALTLIALAAWGGALRDIDLVKGFLLNEFPSGMCSLNRSRDRHTPQLPASLLSPQECHDPNSSPLPLTSGARSAATAIGRKKRMSGRSENQLPTSSP
ncbi:hypothetical protein ACFQQE_00055 [Glycomyces mayteni]|uniref:hypothetical protein n=1 Tax=Glycomyces mayteni TaxID=543887 RepID=UPI00361BF851